MKIGVCASPDNIPLLTELGYDYLESNFSWMASLDETKFGEMTALIQASPLRAESFCIFFPGGMKLYAPDGNQAPLLKEIAAFAEKGFSRAASWGGKIAVIGSGYVRGIPEGMTREETERQFVNVLRVCGDAAARNGMKIVIEPLSRRDCNYIHTVAEGAHVAALTDHPAVGVLVDFFHYRCNGEDISTLPQYADTLYHAHYARPDDRWAPIPGDEDELCKISETLQKCPGIERVTLECTWHPDFETAVRTARPLMDIMKRM